MTSLCYTFSKSQHYWKQKSTPKTFEKNLSQKKISVEKLNFQIKRLAKDVIKVLPKSKLKILKKDDADYRTYIASFKKLKLLFPSFKFKKTPKFASKEIYKILKKNRVNKGFYNNKKFTRLSYLKKKLPNLFKI